MSNPLHDLHGLGQAVWLDAIRRSWLGPEGRLAALRDADEIRGLTSNPTIFADAFSEDDAYAAQLAELRGADPREAFWALAMHDVGEACDLFRPVWDATDGVHGLVSIEVDPTKAFDTDATIDEGLQLARSLDRPNLMVKVPGTEPGLPAITRLLAEGVNVNVTLLFSVARYEAVIDAFIQGVRAHHEAGGDVRRLQSVASFFVSRVDGKVDPLLGDDHPRRGAAAVANARLAYEAFRTRLPNDGGPDDPLADIPGAHPQRPLWASTSTKDPQYRATKYVEALAGPDTVNTMPPATVDATRSGADIADRLSGTAEHARQELDALAADGVDLDQVTKELETEGVEKFEASFEEAVATVSHHLD
ncbi:transaldolase [Egibacter rhizosphaerae]|uniref:Transaldolase n=1 Tax=Egibacter rhizosphaerae TaxID=1670831 RepID=A0A411YKC8_9ACTN|nr:transaldolase [Egibacter rhizosphaerae]QBI21643.1 transaldolase [Egibacter rhizosphaerae]